MFDTVVVVDSLGAWRAPIAGFITQFLLLGYSQSSVILLLGLHEDYDIPHKLLLLTALISSGLTLTVSPAVEFISVRIGSKATVLTSLLLCFLSFLLFFFVPITGVTVLILQGVCISVGRSFGNFITMKYAMISLKTRRGVAASVHKTGASVGAFCFPPLFALLLDVYGVRITLFLIGGIFLNLLIVLVLIPSIVLDDKTGRRLTPPPKWLPVCCQTAHGSRDRAQSVEIRADEQKMIKEPLAVKPVFLLFTCFDFWLMTCVALVSLNVFALYADELGLSKYMIAAILSTRSGVDVCMRLASGILYDKLGGRGKLLTLALTQFVSLVGVVPLLFFTSNAVTILFIHMICSSFCNSFTGTGWMQVVAMLSGTFYMGRVMSLVMFLSGVSLLVISSGLGILRQMMGTYRPLYNFIASGALLSTLCFVLAAVLLSRCSKQPAGSDLEKREMETLNKDP